LGVDVMTVSLGGFVVRFFAAADVDLGAQDANSAWTDSMLREEAQNC
jgi:hypothetical protein